MSETVERIMKAHTYPDPPIFTIRKECRDCGARFTVAGGYPLLRCRCGGELGWQTMNGGDDT